MKTIPKFLMGFLCGSLLVIPASAGHRASLSEGTLFNGMCDASAGFAVTEDLFLVADDEQNLVNTYSRSRPGQPLRKLELSRFLQVAGKSPEVDLEGAARVGNVIYWIGSHGRNEKGELRLSRHRFFATEIVGEEVRPTGKPYIRLQSDLIGALALAPFNLRAAAQSGPKDHGGFNIEGLAARPDGSLLIGFRNPVPNGQTLLIPLLNPAELARGGLAVHAKFGEPILLNLGGRGIRDITLMGETYYILAGAVDGGKKTALYSWNGKDPAVEIDMKGGGKFNPEALMPLPSGKDFFVVSDDGASTKGGKRCKDLPPQERTFRGFLLSLP